MLIKLFPLIILVHLTNSIIQDFPFPLELQLTNITSRSEPYFILIRSVPIIFTTGSTYQLISDDDHNYYLQEDNETYIKYQYFSQNSSDSILLYANGVPTYIIPNLKNFIIIRSCYEEKQYDAKMGLNIVPNPKTDEDKVASDLVLMSYIDYFTKKGTIMVISAMRSVNAQCETSFVIDAEGYFSCKLYHPSEIYYCFWAKSGKSIFYTYFVYNNCLIGEAKTLYTLPNDNNNNIITIKTKSFPDNIGVGILYLSPLNSIQLIKYIVSSAEITIQKEATTSIPCNSIIKMNIIALSDNYFVVSSFDGNNAYCDFYNIELEKLSLDGKNICGYNDFRISFLEDNNLHFIYVQNDPEFIYYAEHEIVQCQSKAYTIDSSDPITISISSLMNPIVKYINPHSGMLLTQIDDSGTLYGNYIEVDYNGNIFTEVDFSNRTRYYQNIKYTAVNPGQNIFEYQLYFEITDVFYIPVQPCQISITNYCYPTCQTCTTIGNDEDNQCDSCIGNALFMYGTSNCYTTKPEGYYIDQITRTYKQCPLNCKSCDDNTSCNECYSDFQLQSTYTKNESDVNCVEQCDLNSSIWYIDVDTQGFVCLPQEECPNKYPCYNPQSRQCLVKLMENEECSYEIPRNVTLDDLFESIDQNVITYYTYHMVYTRKNYTSVVYDSFTTSNGATNLTNLTEIFLGECESTIRERYNLTEKSPLLIAQIEKVNTTNGKTEPLFSFYLSNGTKIDLGVCFNMTIQLNGPSTNEEDLSLPKEEIEDLLEEDIDVFYIDDAFFNDICYPFSYEDNETSSDVNLEDRRKDYYQNTSLCNKDCTYLGMDMSTLKPKCNCTIGVTNEPLGFGEEIVTFFSSLSSANYGVVKCYKLVFSVSIFKYNLGSYILVSMVLMEIVTYRVYVCRRKNDFKKMFLNNNNKNVNTLSRLDNSSFSLSGGMNKQNFTNVSENIEVEYENPKKETNDCLNIEPSQQVVTNQSIDKNKIIYKKSAFSNTNSLMNFRKSKINQWIKTNSNNKAPFEPMADTSIKNLDKLSYAVAIKKDNRTFGKLLIIRIKQFHPVYKCFISTQKKTKYHNIISFIFGLSSDLAFNAFFYSDTYISNTYRKGYNFFYELPKSIISSLISTIVRLLANLLIVDFPDEEEMAKATSAGERRRLLNKINNSTRSFFILVVLLSLLFWYFVTAFCAVYRKSQMNWLYGALTSFAISLVIPFVLAFINVGLRKLSFNCQLEVLFHLSRLIEAY